MDYSAEQLKLIDDLKKQIASCRTQYKQWKDWCTRYGYQEEWLVIGPAIVVKAEYYKGEVMRAKHNIARYMKGRDPDPERYPGLWLEEIDWCLKKLPGEIDERDSWSEKLADLDPQKQKIAKVFYEGAEISYQNTVNSLARDAEWGRRHFYGGTV